MDLFAKRDCIELAKAFVASSDASPQRAIVDLVGAPRHAPRHARG